MEDKNILILTHRQGFEADSVIDELRKQRANVLRFNTDDGDRVSNISYSISSNVNQLLMKCDQRTINPELITKAWFQQPFPFDISSTEEIEALQRANLMAAFSSIEEYLNCEWINKPSSTIQASNKIRQLNIAKQIGMEIPNTLISNDPEEIRDFCKDNPRVMKNLASSWYFSNGRLRAAYTKVVPGALLDRPETLEFCPIIYQEQIEKALECRVVSIGEKIFSVGSEPNQNSIDIRRGNATGGNFVPIDFPQTEHDHLMKFKLKLGIDYCGADYLIDKNGNWIFLEANTYGAWWWVDQHFNGQIKAAFVEALLK